MKVENGRNACYTHIKKTPSTVRFKTEQRIVILKIVSEFSRLDSSSQLANATLIIAQLVLSHNVSASRQSHNKFIRQLSMLAIELNFREQIPSFYRYSQSSYTPLPPTRYIDSQLYCTLAWLDPIFMPAGTLSFAVYRAT